MTMIEIVSLLADMGAEVKYTIRKDGGIRITHINGQTFTGSTGNQIARNMVGVTLSEARKTQLERIRTPKGKWGHKKLEEVSEETKKEIRRLQRMYKKSGSKAGMPTLRKYRENLKRSGKKEAQRLLNQASRYVQGLAYEENVDHLRKRLKADNQRLKNEKLNEAIELMKTKSPIFKESWIKTILQWTYDFETKGTPTAEELGNLIISLIS